MEPQLGALAYTLLGSVGQPEMLYSLGATALQRHVPPELARQLAAPPTEPVALAIEAAAQWVAHPDHHIVTLADAAYPQHLLTIADPPLLLYVDGDPAFLSRPTLAVVGARSASSAGKENAHAFARHLAANGWCVASGLAAGIDAAAHEGALSAGAPGAGTVAIVGTGIDIVYPAQHADLAARISRHGALVSEYPLGQSPRRHHFPQRNRLVAGLAQGVLVVEAARNSGSLITARLAAESGREVFAIPGSIHSPLSRGCHALIRQGAKLVETARDITDELGHAQPPAAAGTLASEARPRKSRPPRRLPPSEPDEPSGIQVGADGQVLLDALGFDPVDLDTLHHRTGLPISTLNAHLLEWELAGILESLPGGQFQRLASATR